MNGITRDTYRDLDTDSKLNVLFDYMHEIHDCACSTDQKFNDFEKKYDNRKRFDTTIAGTSGFIGGFIAVLVKWIVGK